MVDSKAKTDLTKQELMRIFEEQIELKNAEIQRLEGENKKLSDCITLLRKSMSKMEKEHTDMRLAKQELEGRLEAIRQLYDSRRPVHCPPEKTLSEFSEEQEEFIEDVLGVLLKEAENP